MSTRLTVKRGLEAVAITVMRYRCSAGVTRWCCLNPGLPVGTKTTSSSPRCAAASLAATRWPWWMGSNVPPITPMRGRVPAGALMRRAGSVAVADVAERVRDDQSGHERAEGDQAERDGRDRLAGVLRGGLSGQDGGVQHGCSSQSDVLRCALVSHGRSGPRARHGFTCPSPVTTHLVV